MSMLHFETRLCQLIQGNNVNKDLPVPHLIERMLARKEGHLTATGAFVAKTGEYTGRSPMDKFIVKEASSERDIHWGPVNKPISSETFERLYERVLHYLADKDELFVRHGFAGADTNYQYPIRVVNELAWHNLFVRQLFIRPEQEKKATQLPEFTIISAPGFKADPTRDGTRSEAFIIISFEKRTILIGGTAYAGEMKKAIFSIMNYLLPKQGVFSMHCSANVGGEGDVALFFGLSGTGKTTLSADRHRSLIGDDEHAWSPTGIFNIEGGCYAKCINLCKEKEPDIYNAIKFGAVLENVVIDEQTREPDYEATDFTENTRAAYPLTSIDSSTIPSISGHPSTLIFLTADAFGVLPPISKLSVEQAMYHFLSGYTSKLAGTERGISSPTATFSACFGAPFLPLHPSHYAKMLGEKMTEHNTDVFLVNTGWQGGPYGTGHRISLHYTRAMVRAALQGDLQSAETTKDPVFGLNITLHCPGVPDHLLLPWQTWADPLAYEQKAEELAYKFKENFNRFKDISRDVLIGGPLI
ncbi:phosphoenolpyruvate carboxykinase (ATP) [Salipaludibacillus agaradhaerens]|uniref:phosphoenolpyruvate carboxykinase (ATP) n=1 Tax=Salipaludibacillus agaradhaerens TaxID=76935 RepID=UPI0021507D38|nr:phosphoenolpyruvate carboxykinase (ATP) [Salipaludibacillus agaradhaerens]MCR6107672.1 phosphoenolpyruvate carboxykinase (ATP) [Salipaludibacillus agaradhaerens]MCR6119701.1 phosphoenolpyruvate carboxykinase (ATP) [Salipaludibacillus agaradhaerens]